MRILNSLENKGYIERKEDSRDKSRILVNIMGSGKKYCFSIKSNFIDKIICVIKEIGYDEVKEYMRIRLRGF